MHKVNVGVLGCGFWGKNHARVFSELDCCNLVAVADIEAERARNTAEKHHVDWYSDPSKLLERKDIEFLSICTPTVTHASLALKAIEDGKHILVEKPMTSIMLN